VERLIVLERDSLHDSASIQAITIISPQRLLHE